MTNNERLPTSDDILAFVRPSSFVLRLFSPANLLDDITASLNATEMAKRQFREIARVAG